MNKLIVPTSLLLLGQHLYPANTNIYHYSFTNARKQTKIITSSKPPEYMVKRGYVPICDPYAQQSAQQLHIILSMADALSIKHNVDPWLTRAIIQTESAFNPRAVSKAGAMGLMQLIPQTAKRFEVSNPFNMTQNLAGGIKYLKWLENHFEFDYVKVIAAYNAGEKAVQTHKGIPPFSETQNYVPKVITLWQKKSVYPNIPPLKTPTRRAKPSTQLLHLPKS